MHQPPPYIPYHVPPRRSELSGDVNKPHMTTINTVVEKITQELKQILKKDFNKKMIENTAFKRFEKWWEDERSKENKSMKKEDLVAAPVKELPKENNINILLEANRENLYSNASLEFGSGLGLRATLPKMPSFRRKKIPSPVQEDEDSRKLSDSEEIVHNSDTESKTEDMRRVRKVSTSSSSSETSGFSSESESSESEESSSESEEEEEEEIDKEGKKEKERSCTPEGRNTPIPMIVEDMSPICDDIEAVNKTPEPMIVDEDSVDVKFNRGIKVERARFFEDEKPCVVSEESASKDGFINQSLVDDDLSDDEREYLERRRRNTEYMEQIERERKEREQMEAAAKKLHTPSVEKEIESLTLPKTPGEPDRVQEDDDFKIIEQIENERDALLKLDRNPEPPCDDLLEKENSAIDVLTKLAVRAHTSSDEENFELKQKRQEAVNGMTEVLQRSESEDSSPKSQVAIEHSYSLKPEKENIETLPANESFTHDHGYANKEDIKANKKTGKEEYVNSNKQYKDNYIKSGKEEYIKANKDYVKTNKEYVKKKEGRSGILEERLKGYIDGDKREFKTAEKIKEKVPKPRKQKHNRKLQELQNLYNYKSQLEQSYNQQYRHDVKFSERDMVSEMNILYEFLTKGIDNEDICYLRQSYDSLLADDSIGYWLNDTHWVDHCPTDLYSSPPKRRKRDDHRVHATGCARSEGFYKIEANEKAKYKYHHTRSNINTSPEVPVTKTQGMFCWV